MERPIEKLRQLQEDADKKHMELMIEYDLLECEISLMMITNDEVELLRMFASAHKRLSDIFLENQIRIHAKKLESGNHGNGN